MLGVRPTLDRAPRTYSVPCSSDLPNQVNPRPTHPLVPLRSDMSTLVISHRFRQTRPARTLVTSDTSPPDLPFPLGSTSQVSA